MYVACSDIGVGTRDSGWAAAPPTFTVTLQDCNFSPYKSVLIIYSAHSIFSSFLHLCAVMSQLHVFCNIITIATIKIVNEYYML